MNILLHRSDRKIKKKKLYLLFKRVNMTQIPLL
jgi:hypothetical protein